MYIALGDRHVRPVDDWPTTVDDAIRQILNADTIAKADLIVYSGNLRPGYTYFYKNMFSSQRGWIPNAPDEIKELKEENQNLRNVLTDIETDLETAQEKIVNFDNAIQDCIRHMDKVRNDIRRYEVLTDDDQSAKEEAEAWLIVLDDLERYLL